LNNGGSVMARTVRLFQCDRPLTEFVLVLVHGMS